MKKKLLIFIYSLAEGGAEKVASLLASDLCNEYDVHIALLENKIAYNIPSHIPIHVFTTQKSIFKKIINLFIVSKNLKSLNNTYHFDITLTMLNQPIIISVLSKLMGNPSKLIITEHTLQSLWRKNEAIFQWFKKIYLKFFYMQADVIITSSQGIKDDLLNNYHLPQKSIIPIYNPIDLTQINKLKNMPIASIESKQNDPYRIISAGSLNPIKNQSLLLQSFAKLSNPNKELLLLGIGPLKKNLEILAKNIDIENQFHMLGFVKNPYAYFQQSDIFVLTSSFEGFGNVIVEALACECVIISTDCPVGPREILAPNSHASTPISDIEFAEFGILTPLNSTIHLTYAIQYVINNPEIAKKYQNKAKIRAQDFDINKIITNYKIVLDSLH